MVEQRSCKERIGEHYKSRLSDIRTLWTLFKMDPEASDPDIGRFDEYGLSFDYVAPGTFNGQRKGYFRYQISWGGPSDEFRFYTGPEFKPYRVEYWFMDWFDGARRVLKGTAFELMLEIFEEFRECGTVEHVFKKAMLEE